MHVHAAECRRLLAIKKAGKIDETLKALVRLDYGKATDATDSVHPPSAGVLPPDLCRRVYFPHRSSPINGALPAATQAAPRPIVQNRAMRFQASRGTADVLPSESHRWIRLEQEFRDVARLYGYREIRTPTFEDTDLF